MDDSSSPRFVVTAWRHSHELLQLRHDLYSSETLTREKAVNKVFAWRLRKPDGLPLLLESTADIVDVILQDGRGQLQHNALRLLYATALSRFVTGLADTQIDLTRDRPSWFPAGKSLQLPLSLLETRHRIVHRHLPSLAELKRAATESLEWLWEWYWRQLDYAFNTNGAEGNDDALGVESRAEVKEKLQGLLKSYVKERKNEIKRRRDHSKAAETALSTYNLHFSANVAPTRRVLLELLVDDKMILPTDKKLGSSMSGAFLIWTPLLLAFCTSDALSITPLVNHLLEHLSVSRVSGGSDAEDPTKEALYTWAVHILTSNEWASARQISLAKMHQDMLTQIFSSPSFWGLRLAQALLDQGSVAKTDSWYEILAAARDDGDSSVEVQTQDSMDMDTEGVHEAALPVRNATATTMTTTSEEKLRGPVKVLGMWKPRPIGWLAEGWSDDE